MSLCLILRDKENLWVGADTAVSVTINDNIYRLRDEHIEKVFCVNRNIVFCSGLLYVSDRLKEFIIQAGIINISKIQSYAKKLVRTLPIELTQGNHETGLIICTNDGDVISMTQEQDFEIITQQKPKGIQVFTGGFRSDEAMEIAGNALQQGENAIDIFGETYGKLANNAIGGDLILYHIVNGEEKEKYVFKIKEPTEKLTYFQDLQKHAMFAGSVKAKEYLDLSGNSMLTSDYKFSGTYIDAKGLKVANPNDPSRPYFECSQTTGRVQMNDATITGNITMNSGNISWNNVNEYDSNTYQDLTAMQDNIGYTRIGSTYVISPNISGGKITGNIVSSGTINGGYIDGAVIRWGNYGYLQQGTGFDGYNTTTIVDILSNYGMVLTAGGGGLRLQASNGIWLASDTHIRVNGNYVDLGSTIANILAKLG